MNEDYKQQWRFLQRRRPTNVMNAFVVNSQHRLNL